MELREKAKAVVSPNLPKSSIRRQNGILAIVLVLVLFTALSFQGYRFYWENMIQSESQSQEKITPNDGLLMRIPDWVSDQYFSNFTVPKMSNLFTSIDLFQSVIDATNATAETSMLLPKSYGCPYKFKVFIYDIPVDLPSVKVSEEARRNMTLHVCHKCILEQFSLEYIIYDFFHQFCGRTFNPDEADFFYLPIIRDAEFRLTLEKGIRNRAPSSAEMALIDIIERNDSTKWRTTFRVTDKYWHRYHGSDHIIVMAAPVTNFRHETSKRGFFHYMSHLNYPIFVVVEYSLSFVEEYPICATQKNIVVPYPTTDVEFYNGKLEEGVVPRSALIYYAGGLHGDCIEIRRAMQKLMQNSSKLANVVPAVRTVQAEREHGFRAARYCPVPIGDSPSSKRMYDVINFGCIPVVLSDDLVWAYTDQTNGPFNHKSFALHLPQVVVQFPTVKLLRYFNASRQSLGVLPASRKLIYNLLEDAFHKGLEYEKGIYVNPLVHILRRIPDIDYMYLKLGVERVAPYFQFYSKNQSMTDIPTSYHAFPDGKAVKIFTDALMQRKFYTIPKIQASCMDERHRKDHKYISRYPCYQDIGRRKLIEGTWWCDSIKLFDKIY